MADTPISAFPLRGTVLPGDEVPTLAGGVNYRSPTAAIAALVDLTAIQAQIDALEARIDALEEILITTRAARA